MFILACPVHFAGSFFSINNAVGLKGNYKMINVIIVILFLFIATSFHLCGHTIACLLTGIKINKIQFFYGREIVKLNCKVSTISIGWLPTGGSVSYDIEQFQKENLLIRLFILLCGPLFLLISAAIFLKYDLALTYFFRGFFQLVDGSLSPIQKGSYLVSKFFNLLDNQNYIIAYGIFATKIATVNLFPLPPLNGGNIVLEIFSPLLDLKKRMFFSNIGFVFIFIFFVLWLVAIIYSFI